ncbi:MAG: glutamate--tRNA ligase, partial [Candidatus Eremiobacteraeota bacterium]|nr:glutamate--tRNA ligase [Candidatus Eremiobacteraeota bacterium]
KRDGATGVSEYRALGYLADAMVNFLALLGWAPPGGDREIFSRDELTRLFDLDRVQKHGAVFDVVKLTWMNGEYVRSAPLDELVRETVALLETEPEAESLRKDRAHVAAACELMHERTKTLAELVRGSRYLFSSAFELPWDLEAVDKRAGTAEARSRLREAGDALAAEFVWERGEIERVIRGLAERNGRKAAEYISPLRVAITGLAVSAGIFETAEVLGAKITLGRIDAFLRRFSEVAVKA